MSDTGEPVPVLYVAGAGRSGSTFLEQLVCRHPGFRAVGELRYLWIRGVQRNELCSCGRPFHDCPFWTAVLDETFEGPDRTAVAELSASLEYLMRTRRLLGYRFPRLRDAAFTAHLHVVLPWYERLYRAVQQVSGATVVVDSSKFAMYGYLLQQSAALDVRVLHLVRDSRAVAHSWQRRKRRPESTGIDPYMITFSPRQAARIWTEDNAANGALRRSAAHGTLLRYEDLARRPELVAPTLSRLGWNVSQAADGEATEAPEVHSVSGNPGRFVVGDQAWSSPRIDAAWLREMDDRSVALVTALTAPGLLRYGYSLRRTVPGP